MSSVLIDFSLTEAVGPFTNFGDGQKCVSAVRKSGAVALRRRGSPIHSHQPLLFWELELEAPPSPQMTTESAIALQGSLADGFRAFGPFPTFYAAEKFLSPQSEDEAERFKQGIVLSLSLPPS